MNLVQSNNVQIEFPFDEVLKKEKLENKIDKKTSSVNVALSDRDFEVLDFILEMKFSSFDEIYQKFFKVISSDGVESGFWYAKKRLSQLEAAAFIKSTKAFSQSKRLFYCTDKAFYSLQNLNPDRQFLRPSKFIDGRTVIHDYLLLRLRLVLEEKRNINSWISDRTLKSPQSIYSDLGNLYSPDGIYELPSGEMVAFELEISLKAKSRYQEKIKRYATWIRANQANPKSFKKVHYVVTNPTVAKHLRHFCSIYSDYFEIEMIAKYFSESVGLK